MKEKRLVVNFNIEELHSSIIGAMRMLGLPRQVLGYDLLRGSALGLLLEHPKNEKEAILRAIEMTTIPSSKMLYNGAIGEMFYCVEGTAALKVDKKKTQEEIVFNVLHKICKFVECDFYRYKIHDYLENHGFKERTIKTEILNNLLYKRMMENATEESLLIIFAYKKTFQKEPDSLEKARTTICDYLTAELSEKTVLEYVNILAEDILNCNS